MTVSYSKHIVTSEGIGGNFIKLLFRWKASVYKLIYKEYLSYIIAWYVISLLYRFGFSEDQKEMFDSISKTFEGYANQFPLAFVLGFYVAAVYKRWWDQYCSIPWTTTLSLRVAANLYGKDEDAHQIRQIRRTILRYSNLTILLTFQKISPKIREKYPTLDNFIDQGLLSEEEKKLLEKEAREVEEWMKIDKTFSQGIKDNKVEGNDSYELLMNTTEKKTPTKDLSIDYFLPMVWATRIITKARVNGHIQSDYAMNEIMDEIISIRSGCAILLRYDGICVPLVYTQVVTIAVYSFFMSTLIGRQFRQDDTDLYFPLFTSLEFILYIGWLKVAEAILNPYGGDDDDFKLYDISTYNRRIGYQIVDNDKVSEEPKMSCDKHWDITSKVSQKNTIHNLNET